jgi:hypothetical protein
MIFYIRLPTQGKLWGGGGGEGTKGYRGGFVEHLSQTSIAQKSMTKFMTLEIVN